MAKHLSPEGEYNWPSIISPTPRGPDLSPMAEVRAILEGAVIRIGSLEQDLAALD